MKIQRYISEDRFDLLKTHSKNLITIVNNSKGELDLQLRDNYLNVYYKGNSLAKVQVKRDSFKIEVHGRFGLSSILEDFKLLDKVKSWKRSSAGIEYFTGIKPAELKIILQSKVVARLKSAIKKVNNGEEITLEQMIITDTRYAQRGEQKLIYLDRQVSVLKNRMLDLLFLKRSETNSKQYDFLVVEVKLGNNPELKEKVVKQLEDYTGYITDHLDVYKECYLKNYRQKFELGLLEAHPETIEFSDSRKVDGLIFVSGYQGIANESLKDFKSDAFKIQRAWLSLDEEVLKNTK